MFAVRATNRAILPVLWRIPDSEDFFRHGRLGQKQAGIDIWGTDDQRQIVFSAKTHLKVVP